jgi:hypothetical protein
VTYQYIPAIRPRYRDPQLTGITSNKGYYILDRLPSSLLNFIQSWSIDIKIPRSKTSTPTPKMSTITELLTHQKFETLSQEQVDAFMKRGWLRLPGAIIPEKGEEWTKNVWHRLGMYASHLSPPILHPPSPFLTTPPLPLLTSHH